MEDLIEFVEEEDPDIIIHELVEIGLRKPPNVKAWVDESIMFPFYSKPL